MQRIPARVGVMLMALVSGSVMAQTTDVKEQTVKLKHVAPSTMVKVLLRERVLAQQTGFTMAASGETGLAQPGGPDGPQSITHVVPDDSHKKLVLRGTPSALLEVKHLIDWLDTKPQQFELRFRLSEAPLTVDGAQSQKNELATVTAKLRSGEETIVPFLVNGQVLQLVVTPQLHARRTLTLYYRFSVDQFRNWEADTIKAGYQRRSAVSGSCLVPTRYKALPLLTLYPNFGIQSEPTDPKIQYVLELVK